jgi:hypothetical protein
VQPFSVCWSDQVDQKEGRTAVGRSSRSWLREMSDGDSSVRNQGCRRMPATDSLAGHGAVMRTQPVHLMTHGIAMSC